MSTTSFPYLKPIVAGLTAVFWAGCFAQPGLTGHRDRPPITNAPTVAGPATPAPAPAPVAPVAPRQPMPTPATISPAVAEVITLVQSGVDEAVIKSFVGNATNQFNPTLEEIIYLSDVGVSSTLVAALIQQSTRARDARDQREAMAKAAAANNPAAAPPAVKVVIDDRRPQVEAIAPPANPAPAPAPVVAAPAQTAPAPTPQGTTIINNYTYFHDQLAPYGRWVDLPAYGRCWQPSVVIGNPHWRPYADRGRWHWSNHGWYWQSDYSWGWAPFHYGRWCQEAGLGWVWVPGNVWGPSWVSWRTSDSHIGWAPLPPQAVFRAGVGFSIGVGAAVVTGYEWNLSLGHYTFVALGRFCDRNPAYYSVPVTQARTVYNQTIVNNNYITTNTTVINQGLPAERVAALTRQEVRKVMIRDLPAANATVRPDRLEKEGAEVVIYRPQLQTQSPQKPANLASGNTPTVAGVTATAQNPNVITGRPVYASNGGTPVITGYTTQPAPATTLPAPAIPTGLTPASTTPPSVSLNPPAQKGFGITPTTRATEPVPAVPHTGGVTQSTPVRRVETKPNPTPAPAPTPVTTGPRTSGSPTVSGQALTPPQPVTSVAPTFSAPQPVRQEVTKPYFGNNPGTFTPRISTPSATTTPAPTPTVAAPRNQPALQPYFPTAPSRPSTPAVSTPAPAYNPAPPPARPTFNTQPSAPTPTAPSFNPGRPAPSSTPSFNPSPAAPAPPASSPTGNPKQEQKK